MLPSRLFRSRWSALLWSAGILWTANDVASADHGAPRSTARPPVLRDAAGEAIDPAALAALANAAG